MGALRNRFGAVRPENGKEMGWLSNWVSTLLSALQRKCPRPGASVVLLLLGLDDGSGLELVALSYSIVAVDTLSSGLNGTSYKEICTIAKKGRANK
jgi:hypothetical protein